jgi:hypothetical protein
MSNGTLQPKCKTRIDPIAKDAIDEIDRALADFAATKQLNLNLAKIRQDLVDIKGDNHSPQ